MASKDLERAVELATGQCVSRLRRTTVDERRAAVERARGKVQTFRSHFPLVGRGNVLRDRAVPHDQVEQDFLKAVHGK